MRLVVGHAGVFSTRRSAWYHQEPRLLLVDTNKPELVGFDPEIHGRLVIRSTFHKNGRWSYWEYELVLPEGVVALDRGLNDRNGRFTPFRSWAELEEFLRFSGGVKWQMNDHVKDVFRDVFPEDARIWDREEAPAPTAEDIFGRAGQ